TPIALLAVDINYKTFQTILENSFYENSGDCFILTGEQELFHVGENLYEKEEKGYIFDKGKEMMKENLIVDTFQSKEKTFYISSRQNMLSGWKIIQIIPEEKMFEEINQKIKWNTIFLLGALVLVVSFSIYYTKKIIEPLEEFCKKISHTREDQLQIINLEHMKLTKEIANVIENYNGMANRMNEYLVREIIYEKNQRKIQSKMLRYQINPHFLYNTLNLIASMGELSDFPEIVEITKNLSCIMQYNVKGSRFVSLKTEVEMVKAYLEIQRIRFHDCFSVEYEIEKQIEEIKIVKFILQPIVENIFEHGFAMDENENKIWIKAFKSEDNIVILVKDNGYGISEDKREELNQTLCEKTGRISYIDDEEKSIGINNVNTRIKNYYGEEYGVKINKIDKGTEIQLLLGIERLKEEIVDK
uniref:sensor histidine kinase n=1 Tax=Blautia sp. TaxID=1955243 RepID=UPI002620F9A5